VLKKIKRFIGLGERVDQLGQQFKRFKKKSESKMEMLEGKLKKLDTELNALAKVVQDHNRKLGRILNKN